MIDSYLTLNESVAHKLTRKKSRFIALLSPVTNGPDVERRLQAIRKTYHDATHHCFAARWLEAESVAEVSSDDGEPAGSAGLPILQQVAGRELVNLLAVVVRYYGGINLGVGGLIRAYSDATSEALDAASIVRRKVTVHITIRFPVEVNSAVMSIIHRFQASVESLVYEDPVHVDVTLPPSQVSAFRAALVETTGARAEVEISS